MTEIGEGLWTDDAPYGYDRIPLDWSDPRGFIDINKRVYEYSGFNHDHHVQAIGRIVRRMAEAKRERTT